MKLFGRKPKAEEPITAPAEIIRKLDRIAQLTVNGGKEVEVISETRTVKGWRGEKCPFCGNYGTHTVFNDVSKTGVPIVYIECSVCGERCPLRGEL